MDCPSCQAPTRVLESRPAEGGGVVRRRRSCPQCDHRFTTYERREAAGAYVRKRGGERAPFDRAKLRGALSRAAHKRPVSPADVETIVGRIEAAVRDAGGELATERIGELAVAELRALDPGAYLQFLGVFGDLADPSYVRSELARLQRPQSEKVALSERPARAGSVRVQRKDPQPTSKARTRRDTDG
ncbi:MAG: transcriptional regulator NrdR [bacterium]